MDENDRVRRFNRTVTQRVGALSDRYLSRDRPLGEARVLWEIGEEGCEVRALRARLDLDSGHASRLLRALEADGMVAVSPSPADGRVRMARLTEAGRGGRAARGRGGRARAAGRAQGAAGRGPARTTQPAPARAARRRDGAGRAAA